MQQRDDIQDLHAEVAGLRAELDAMRAAAHRPWRERLPRRLRFRRSGAIGLVALMLALPIVVSAGHNFSDVPNSHTFHSSVANLYGARLTGGCSATRYCPSASVTRGQMAAFLNRGLGRAASAAGFYDFDDDWAIFETGALASVDLLSGGGTGGTAHVLVQANVSAYTDEAGVCPCEMRLALVNADTGEESTIMYDVIGSEPGPAIDPEPPFYEASSSISYLFSVPSGVTHTYILAAEMYPTLAPSPENDAGVEFSLSAVYIPFAASGGNPTLPYTSGTVQGSPRGD